ncbi:MAG: ribosome maturation factor RimM [Bacillota bacterium]
MNTIVIGTIKKPHGIKGRVSVRAETDFTDVRFQEGATVFLRCRGELKKTTIQEHGGHRGGEILGFEGIDTVEEAEKLRNCTIEVDAESRHALEDDAFYYDTLEGMSVHYQKKKIGVVKSVMDMPQGAMLRIERPGSKDALVPFMKHFIKEVDEDDKTITLNEIEGLL